MVTLSRIVRLSRNIVLVGSFFFLAFYLIFQARALNKAASGLADASESADAMLAAEQGVCDRITSLKAHGEIGQELAAYYSKRCQ